MVLNTEPLDWESSTLTAGPHRKRKCSEHQRSSGGSEPLNRGFRGQPLRKFCGSEEHLDWLNDAHRENIVLLISVQEFIEIQAWLLLTFFLCLHNQLIFVYYIVTKLKNTDV